MMGNWCEAASIEGELDQCDFIKVKLVVVF